MKIALSKTLLESLNIHIFNVSISSEADWNKKNSIGFVKKDTVVDIDNSIFPEGRTKLTFDCYTTDSRHIHLFLKDNLDKGLEELVIEQDDIIMLDIGLLMESPGCQCPWLSPVMSSSGDLTVCCNDSFFDLSVGDLNDHDFCDLWFKGERIRRYRYDHIIGNYENTTLCQRCLGKKSMDLSTALIKEYTGDDQYLFGMEKYYKARLNNKKIIKHLMLELSSICQNECEYCNQSMDSIIKNRGKDNLYMDANRLEGLMGRFDAEDYFFENIHLFWLGEPLLHPEFNEIFSILRKKKQLFTRIELHTNAIALDEDIIESIADLELPIRVHYSVDANTADIYNKIKKNDCLEKIKDNIKRSIEKTKRKDHITHVIQFIVHKQNHNEVDDFIKYWESFFKEKELDFQLTSYFDFNRKHIIYLRKWDPVKEEDIKISDRLFLQTRENIVHKGHEGFIDLKDLDNKKTLDHICFSPFEYLVISASGKITFCCHDTMLQNVEFNIFDSSIEDYEDVLKRFIDDHISDRIKLCRDCLVKDSVNSHRAVMEEVLYFCRRFKVDSKKILEKELI